MYIGVKGSSFVRRRRDIRSLDVMSCFFMYIGLKGSSFLRGGMELCVISRNVVGFCIYRCEWLIFFRGKEGHLGHWI